MADQMSKPPLPAKLRDGLIERLLALLAYEETDEFWMHRI